MSNHPDQTERNALIAETFLNNRWGLKECGKYFQLDSTTIGKILTKHGITERHRHQYRGEFINRVATLEYSSYTHARERCRNPKHKHYAYYGGRGIEFRFSSFQEFLEHIGRRPSVKHSLDRINNDGHYEIGNVRWATPEEQHRNRRGRVMLTVNGETRFIQEWAQLYTINPRTISSRIHDHKWCATCAVTLPVMAISEGRGRGSSCPHNNT